MLDSMEKKIKEPEYRDRIRDSLVMINARIEKMIKEL